MATQTEILAVKGTVKSYSTKKGFGFIDCKDERRDVFVYNTHLVGRVGLVPGEEVEFTLCFDGERPQARNVRVTHAAPQAATSTNAKDHPLEALTEAISRKSDSPKPVEEMDDVEAQKSIRESALKAQAAQAVEVPTPPVGIRKQTDIQEQIRSAQTQAMEEKRKQNSVIIQGNRPVTTSTEASVDVDRELEWAHQWSQDQWSPEKPKSKLPTGAEISIMNFPAQDLIGQKGIVKDYDAATDRYQIEVEIPAKPGSLEKGTSMFSLRDNQLRIEKIPIAPRPKAEESTLSASAEPFNPMGSALEWAAVQGLNNLGGKGNMDLGEGGPHAPLKGDTFGKGRDALSVELFSGKGDMLSRDFGKGDVAGKGNFFGDMEPPMHKGLPLGKGDFDFFGKGDMLMDPFLAAKGEFLMSKGRDPFLAKGGKDMMMLAAAATKGGKESFLAAAKGDYMKGEYMLTKGDLMVAKGKGSMDPVLAERGALMAKGGKDIMMAAAAKGDFGLMGKGIPDFLKGKGDPLFGVNDPFFTKGNPFLGKGDPFLGKSDPFLGKSDPFMVKGDPHGKGDLHLSKGDPHLGKGELLGKGEPVLGKGDSAADFLTKGTKGSLLGKGDPFAAKGELLAAKGKGSPSEPGKGASLTPEELVFFASKGPDAKRAGKPTSDGPDARPSDTRQSVPRHSPPKPVHPEVPKVSCEIPGSKNEVAERRYNPSLAGNPGYAGALWKVRQCADFQHVIIRKGRDVLSAETHRLRPDETCYQDGPMETLESGVVRMPIRPEGWVTVHARLLNGPTFLDMVSNDEAKTQIEPEYTRAELLTVGKILGLQDLVEGHLLASVRAMRMPELCRDHTAHTAKLERREARQAQKEKERERLERNGREDRVEETGKNGKGDYEKEDRSAAFKGESKGMSKGKDDWNSSGWKEWNDWGNQDWDGNWGKDTWTEWKPSDWSKPREEVASKETGAVENQEEEVEKVEQTPEKVEKAEQVSEKTPTMKTEQPPSTIRKNCNQV